jgi:transmembrane sensor
MDEAADPANEAQPARASEWLVALAERPENADLRTRFEAWLAASPLHAEEWADISRTARLVQDARPATPQPWEAFAERRRAERAAGGTMQEAAAAVPLRRRVRTSRWRWAPLLAAAACLFLVFGLDPMTSFRADHITAARPSGEIRLADGSIVRLAPRSAIDVAGTRHVRLLKGEAFFEVVHDERQPFVVETRDFRVRDLGTAFDVRLGAETTDVAVREGLIEVKPVREASAAPMQLAPGDWLRLSSAGRAERGRMAPDDVAAWTRGHLVAKNRPVSEVVDELRPYFDGFIVLRGERLPGQPLTGFYDLSDPLAALNAVARAQGATVRQPLPWIVVISGP